MTADAPAPEDWQQPSLAGLAAVTVETMPSFEVLFLDDVAAFLMGPGPLEPPYTVEYGTRVLSSLLGAVVNSARYTPEQAPAVTTEIETARACFVQGAHDFAASGADGLALLVNRLVPAVVGELEIHRESPEEQTRSLFYYGLLAVASGPPNVVDEDAATGVMHLFHAWDEEFGKGFMVPWRKPVTVQPSQP